MAIPQPGVLQGLVIPWPLPAQLTSDLLALRKCQVVYLDLVPSGLKWPLCSSLLNWDLTEEGHSHASASANQRKGLMVGMHL